MRRAVGGAQQSANASSCDVIIHAHTPTGPPVQRGEFDICGGTRVDSGAKRVLRIIGHFEIEPERISQGREHGRNEAFTAAGNPLFLPVNLDRAGENAGSIAGPAFIIIDQCKPPLVDLQVVGLAEAVPNIGAVRVRGQVHRP